MRQKNKIKPCKSAKKQGLFMSSPENDGRLSYVTQTLLKGEAYNDIPMIMVPTEEGRLCKAIKTSCISTMMCFTREIEGMCM